MATIFYQIKCKDTSITECYIGSTGNFYRRKTGHKFAYTNEKGRYYNYKVYKFIREHGNWENWEFIVLHTEPYTTKEAKLIKEQELIEIHKPILNSNNAYGLNIEKNKINKQEYAKTDKYKEKVKEYQKTDKYKEKQKEYQKSDKYKEYQNVYKQSDKRKEYNKEYHKTDKYKEYQKIYYLKNKAKQESTVIQ